MLEVPALRDSLYPTPLEFLANFKNKREIDNAILQDFPLDKQTCEKYGIEWALVYWYSQNEINGDYIAGPNEHKKGVVLGIYDSYSQDGRVKLVVEPLISVNEKNYRPDVLFILENKDRHLIIIEATSTKNSGLRKYAVRKLKKHANLLNFLSEHYNVSLYLIHPLYNISDQLHLKEKILDKFNGNLNFNILSVGYNPEIHLYYLTAETIETKLLQDSENIKVLKIY